MEPREFTKTPMTLYPWTPRPYTNITPFTVRDAATMLEILEKLRHWLRVELVPHVDEEIKKLVDAWEDNILEIITSVEDQLNDQNAEFNQLITDFTNQITEQLAQQDQDVADAINSIINNSLEVNDQMVVQMVEDAQTLTGAKLRELFVSVSDYTSEITGIHDLISSVSDKASDNESDIVDIRGELGERLSEESLNNLADSRAQLEIAKDHKTFDLKSSIVELGGFADRSEKSSRVMQSVQLVRELNNEVWYSQIDSGVSDPERESVRIIRCNADGTRLEEAYFPDAGHGLGMAIEVDATGKIWCWTTFFDYSMGSSNVQYHVVRLPWSDRDWTLNEALVYEVAALNRGSRMTVHLDLDNNIVGVREIKDTPSIPYVYTVHDYDNIINGVWAPISECEFKIPTGSTGQGAAYLDGYWYYLSGNVGEPSYIRQYDANNGQLVYEKELLGVAESQVTRIGFVDVEPEGLSVYHDVKGVPSLVFGVSIGAAFGRGYTLWSCNMGTSPFSPALIVDSVYDTGYESSIIGAYGAGFSPSSNTMFTPRARVKNDTLYLGGRIEGSFIGGTAPVIARLRSDFAREGISMTFAVACSKNSAEQSFTTVRCTVDDTGGIIVYPPDNAPAFSWVSLDGIAIPLDYNFHDK